LNGFVPGAPEVPLKELSIPLNGFLVLSPQLELPQLQLSIPLNGFNIIIAVAGIVAGIAFQFH
jgi:hypothetical protein